MMNSCVKEVFKAARASTYWHRNALHLPNRWKFVSKSKIPELIRNPNVGCWAIETVCFAAEACRYRYVVLMLLCQFQLSIVCCFWEFEKVDVRDPTKQAHHPSPQKSRNLSSHIELHTHASSASDNCETLTFLRQGQCMVSGCRALRLVLIARVVFSF